MFLLDLLLGGAYSIYFIPFHLIPILIGVLICYLLKKPRHRRIWLGIEVLVLILCRVFFSLVSSGLYSLAVFFLTVLFADLLIGHGIVGLIHLFRRFVNWIHKDENSQ